MGITEKNKHRKTFRLHTGRHLVWNQNLFAVGHLVVTKCHILLKSFFPMWICVVTTTGARDSFPVRALNIRRKQFYISCLPPCTCFAVLVAQQLNSDRPLTSSWGHWPSSDKEPFLRLSWQLPGKDTSRQSDVKEQVYTQKPGGQRLSWKYQRGWHFQRHSRTASIRENTKDFLQLFEHYSGSYNKWCQLFVLTW